MIGKWLFRVAGAVSSRHFMAGSLAAGCATSVLLLGPGAVFASQAASPSLDAGDIGWSRATYRARKFFVTANADVKLAVVPSASIENDLLAPDAPALLNPTASTARLTYLADAMGRETDTTLLMRPASAQILQYRTLEAGKRLRTYRYLEAGFYRQTWRPLDSEKKQAPDRWTDVSSGQYSYGDDPENLAVIDPLGLLYIVSAAELETVSADLEFLAYDDDRFSRIVISFAELSPIAVDFTISTGSGERRCEGKVMARHVLLKASPYGAGTEARFDFLGLQGDLSVYIEPETKLPLVIAGQAKVVGDLQIKLRSAELADQKCPKFNG